MQEADYRALPEADTYILVSGTGLSSGLTSESIPRHSEIITSNNIKVKTSGLIGSQNYAKHLIYLFMKLTGQSSILPYGIIISS